MVPGKPDLTIIFRKPTRLLFSKESPPIPPQFPTHPSPPNTKPTPRGRPDQFQPAPNLVPRAVPGFPRNQPVRQIGCRPTRIGVQVSNHSMCLSLFPQTASSCRGSDGGGKGPVLIPGCRRAPRRRVSRYFSAQASKIVTLTLKNTH